MKVLLQIKIVKKIDINQDIIQSNLDILLTYLNIISITEICYSPVCSEYVTVSINPVLFPVTVMYHKLSEKIIHMKRSVE